MTHSKASFKLIVPGSGEILSTNYIQVNLYLCLESRQATVSSLHKKACGRLKTVPGVEASGWILGAGVDDLQEVTANLAQEWRAVVLRDVQLLLCCDSILLKQSRAHAHEDFMGTRLQTHTDFIGTRFQKNSWRFQKNQTTYRQTYKDLRRRLWANLWRSEKNQTTNSTDFRRTRLQKNSSRLQKNQSIDTLIKI